VPSGSIIRPPEQSAFPFDHCSIQATLHRLFDLGEPLTARVAAAPDLLSALSLEEPENKGPETIISEVRRPSRGEVRDDARRSRNHHQRDLLGFMHILPGGAAHLVGRVRGLGARAVPENWWQRR
jgi:hypothetical protein